MDAQSKVTMLEARVEEREKEIESLLKSNNEQRASTVHVLETLLETERTACAEENNRAEALFVQLQATQGKLDLLQQQLPAVRLNETSLDSKLKTASRGKRVRVDDYEMGVESFHDMDTNDKISLGNKRPKSTTSPLMFASPEDGGSVFKVMKGTTANKPIRKTKKSSQCRNLSKSSQNNIEESQQERYCSSPREMCSPEVINSYVDYLRKDVCNLLEHSNSQLVTYCSHRVGSSLAISIGSGTELDMPFVYL